MRTSVGRGLGRETTPAGLDRQRGAGTDQAVRSATSPRGRELREARQIHELAAGLDPSGSPARRALMP